MLGGKVFYKSFLKGSVQKVGTLYSSISEYGKVYFAQIYVEISLMLLSIIREPFGFLLKEMILAFYRILGISFSDLVIKDAVLKKYSFKIN
jgi:hypothetical protein